VRKLSDASVAKERGRIQTTIDHRCWRGNSSRQGSETRSNFAAQVGLRSRRPFKQEREGKKRFNGKGDEV